MYSPAKGLVKSSVGLYFIPLATWQKAPHFWVQIIVFPFQFNLEKLGHSELLVHISSQ